MPLQQIIPTWTALNTSNDTSPSGLLDFTTGEPIFAGGLNLGDYFDLTEKEANAHSDLNVGLLHVGRYRRIQVHAGATAANVVTGKLGTMVPELVPEVNIVTSMDLTFPNRHPSVRIVIFLNAIDPGNYGFVQELGIGMVLCSSTVASGVVVGSFAYGSNLRDGTVDETSLGTAGPDWVGHVGFWLDEPVADTLVRMFINRPAYQG